MGTFRIGGLEQVFLDCTLKLRQQETLHFWPEEIFKRFEHPSLQIEVPQIIIHKTYEPDVDVDLLCADGLSSQDLAEIDLFVAETDAATAGDHDGFVVKGIVDVPSSRCMGRIEILT